MRKLIIKYFALEYISIFNGKIFNWVRAANVIFPLMCINGVYSVKTNSFFYETTIGVILFMLLLISLFFGFVYFRLKPVKYDELTDRSQKYFWFKFTGAEQIDLQEIFYSKKWHNVATLLVNPIFAVISIILMI